MSRQRQSDRPSTIPDAVGAQVVERLNQYCEQRVPPRIIRRDEWTESKVAQFRYDVEAEKWTLFCCDRNSKWHEYLELAPSSEFETLLAEVEDDPTGIFWG